MAVVAFPPFRVSVSFSGGFGIWVCVCPSLHKLKARCYVFVYERIKIAAFRRSLFPFERAGQ